MAVVITVAVDGSCLNNPGPSGWAWYLDDDNWAAGGFADGTNNQGELLALINLLREFSPELELEICADSQYVINIAKQWLPMWKAKGWRKADNKPIKNLELIQELDTLLAGRKISFTWVKGHSGNHMNECADTLARAAATAVQQGKPVDCGPGLSACYRGETYQENDHSRPAITAKPSKNPRAKMALMEGEETSESVPKIVDFFGVTSQNCDQLDQPDLFTAMAQDIVGAEDSRSTFNLTDLSLPKTLAGAVIEISAELLLELWIAEISAIANSNATALRITKKQSQFFSDFAPYLEKLSKVRLVVAIALGAQRFLLSYQLEGELITSIWQTQPWRQIYRQIT